MFIQKLIDYLNTLAVEPRGSDRWDQNAICVRIKYLCRNNNVNFNTIKHYIELLMTQWPNYSGDPLFPVPHPEHDAETAFFIDSVDRWDPATEYGRLRRELCKYLAARLQSGLEQ